MSVDETVSAGKNVAGNPMFVTVRHGTFVWPQEKTILMEGDR